jgi:hypothetical protein
MIWKDATLITFATETDRLGNEVKTDTEAETKPVLLRPTPWTAEEILLDTREVTKTEQRFAVPLPYAEAARFTHARIEDVLYEITTTENLSPRWSVLHVKAYKHR